MPHYEANKIHVENLNLWRFESGTTLSKSNRSMVKMQKNISSDTGQA